MLRTLAFMFTGVLAFGGLANSVQAKGIQDYIHKPTCVLKNTPGETRAYDVPGDGMHMHTYEKGDLAILLPGGKHKDGVVHHQTVQFHGYWVKASDFVRVEPSNCYDKIK